MAAPPLIPGAPLPLLSWRTRERAWRTGLAAPGAACLPFGASVAVTAPDSFAISREPGGPGRWIHPR